MRFGVAIPTWGPFGDVGALQDCLGLAEHLGFESAWFADHLAIPAYATDRFVPPMAEPLALAGWALARYERLSIGIDVLVAPYRHPVQVAAVAGTLQRLSGGRLSLGMGIGYLRGEFSALGLEIRDRARVTDETLQALRMLWSGHGPHDFQGTTFRFDDILSIAVPQPRVPLLVGGNNHNALRRAARLGDGWHPLYPSPEQYGADRQTIEQLRRAEGLEHPFVYSFSAHLCRVTDEPIEGDGLSENPGPLRTEYGYSPPIPRQSSGRPLLNGSADQVAADIDEYRFAGVEQMVLRVWSSTSGSGVAETMDQMTKWAELLQL